MAGNAIAASPIDVFLSHSTADDAWALELKAELEAVELSVFIDNHDLHAGDDWVGGIEDGLARSRSLVLIYTGASLASQWVGREWRSFLARHGPSGKIFPVLLEPVAIPMLLGPVQHVNALDRDARRVAAELVPLIGRLGELEEGDARRITFDQDLVFTLGREGDTIAIDDPLGRHRVAPPPWEADGRFPGAFVAFQALARGPVRDDAGRAELVRHATALGDALGNLLFDAACADRLRAAMAPGRPRPRVTLVGDDDVLLALPWELIRLDGRFLVRDGLVNLARTNPPKAGDAAPRPPTGAFELVVNVSAPEGSGLSYEAESYRITRALTARCRVVPTELGTLDDLAATVARERPTGIHYSGHGAPGRLDFEDDEGRSAPVAIADLVDRLRLAVPDNRLPPFFYLASCRGNDPGAPAQGRPGAEASAARLHRAGVAVVVGYFGPIGDDLSTHAEEALYGAVAAGHPTGHAVHLARQALTRSAAYPFAWAQLGCYRRGPDLPLGLPVARDPGNPEQAPPRRTFLDAGTRRILMTGFIGRRADLHRLRRAIREGQRVFVLQGLGGLGKSTLAIYSLPLLGPKDSHCALWCQDAAQQADGRDAIAAALVGQLLEDCRRRFGLAWEGVVRQVDAIAGDDPARRFASFLRELLDRVPRLVLYLDNLESLLVGPDDPRDRDEAAFGAWRSASLAAIWSTLVDHARDGAKLHVVASCRYRHADFAEWLIPIAPLPDDALFRLMDWFDGLRRLAVATRARWVGRLAGHPRAVEFADILVRGALTRWKGRHGDWRLPSPPGPDDLEREWVTLVEPTLPKVQDRLRDDLLFDALWDHVLDDPARRMLYRMTLLRRPWRWDLMKMLGDPDGLLSEAEKIAEQLRDTSLVGQVDLTVPIAIDQLGTVRHFTLHPSTAAFVALRFGDDAPLRLATHRRVGVYLEIQSRTSPDLSVDVEAGHHLFQAGEFERSFALLAAVSDGLQERGRVPESQRLLEPFLPDPVRGTLERASCGKLYRLMGNVYVRLGYAEKAIEHYEQVLAIERELGDREGEGSTLGNMGLAYADLGREEEASRCHEQALEIARERGDRRGEGVALHNLGLAYASLGAWGRAIGNHEQALALLRVFGVRREVGAVLGGLGTTHAAAGELEKAIEYHEQSLAIAREVVDRRGEGSTLGNLGDVHAALGHAETAIRYLEQALAIAREVGDRRAEEHALGNLGNAFDTLGEPEQAIGFYDQALAIARAIGDRQGEGHSLGNLSNVYGSLSQLEKTIAYSDQALRIVQETVDRRSEGKILGNLGNTYARLGESTKGIEYQEQSLAIAREVGDRQGEVRCLINLGLPYADSGQMMKAIGYFEEALALARTINYRRGEGIALGVLGLAHMVLGELEKAREYYEQALRIGREINDLGIVRDASSQLERLKSRGGAGNPGTWRLASVWRALRALFRWPRSRPPS